ncbi:Magnesium-transporting ATPase, P-type 1 [bioreactor metagenome]|jgi:magnesium-translocating P-type ATPase|uniref:Magnesium-transporting ATPase, P-type 1 n=1 Tax=bioreactor metagenome TaxID=1076179 RepID=A0A644V5H1_9ZZZZ|nr:magnesium-translocating P-type ATPase [Acidaminococcaceae bacterium]
MPKQQHFWALDSEILLASLQTKASGLSTLDAQKKLINYGKNSIVSKDKTGPLVLFLTQFENPIILILLFATVVSIYVGEQTDAMIIFFIIVLSGLLSFWQEYTANKSMEKLLDMVKITTTVLRDDKEITVNNEDVVPGDIAILSAGSMVPSDGLLLESESLLVDESALTGEPYPIEKQASILDEKTPLAARTNSLWMGTHVVSGSGKLIVVNTGPYTKFGEISQQLSIKKPETEFERGIRKFGFMLMIITTILVFTIFAVNIFLKKPLLDTFMFSLALAVGLTPQLLPAIVSINLSRGSKVMAKEKVIVKRLSSIENLGSMNILCSDKTGTLTDGNVKVKDSLSVDGNFSKKVFLYAYLNSMFESGFLNPIDTAIRSHDTLDISEYKKIGEQPYDFIRKRLSVFVTKGNNPLAEKTIITKGAFDKVIDICTKIETEKGTIDSIEKYYDDIVAKYQELSTNGYRTLGIAYKDCGENTPQLTRDDESDMIFLGFITLFDSPKAGIKDTIKKLENLGISLKIITGDNRFIAANVMQQLGYPDAQILTGAEIRDINDIALVHKALQTKVFAEIEPNQKERIILALKKSDNVVGYIGDGINDVSALHDADVSISVDSAVDVAKETADIVLLEKNLEVLVQGVLAGRTTFTNTMKYVFMATSANFGNMFSMAGASLFLPFLPLLPKQVLLTNLMTDLPAMTIASDNVEPDVISKPHRWDISFIKKFMLTFGLISSIFDYITFGVLILVLDADETLFQTGWFMESVISASIIVLVIRSRKLFFKSKPSKNLIIATFSVVIATFLLQYTPLASILGFEQLPAQLQYLIAGIVCVYILVAELAKKVFYRFFPN